MEYDMKNAHIQYQDKTRIHIYTYRYGSIEYGRIRYKTRL